LDSIKLLEDGSKYRADLPQFLAQKLDKKDSLEQSIQRILTLTGRALCALCCEHFAKKGENGEERKRGKTKCCRTLFCVPCLERWMAKQPRCPKCARKMTNIDTSIDIDAEPVDEKITAHDGTLKDKMEKFHEILKKETEREGFRILVFSELTGTFVRVQNILKEEALSFAEIEGNQYTMDRALTDYKSGKRPILLVDSQAFAAGMNLEMTTAVLIMHKTEREAQMVGRAQRLGRTDRLHVHHLVYPKE
jgi:SNF2 family DNA or RNA helicase